MLIISSVSTQDYRGKVQESVTDEAGGSVPGVQVVLRNTLTGVDEVADNENSAKLPGAMAARGY